MSTAETRPNRSIGLSALLSFAAALFAAAAVALHFIGDTAHRAYLRYWGVDSGAFPKSADWLLINGYLSLYERFLMLLTEAWRNWYWLVGFALVFSFYVALLIWPTPKGPEPKWFAKLGSGLRRLAACFAIVGWLLCFLLTTLALITFAMGAVAALGYSAGTRAAEVEQAEYSKGCGVANYFCVDIVKDGKIIYTGFVLDSSVSHVAILDVASNRGHVVERVGTEISAHPKRPTTK